MEFAGDKVIGLSLFVVSIGVQIAIKIATHPKKPKSTKVIELPTFSAYDALFQTDPIDYDQFENSENNDVFNDYVDRRKWLVPRDESIVHDRNIPRLLVCHDMRGNYLGDKYHRGCRYDDNAFQLFHWEIIDIFCYFSHKFITVPPISWINNCRLHNTLVLGTVITEWERGKQMCSYFLGSVEKMQSLVTVLVQSALLNGLDGWLINIENSLELHEVEMMKAFLCELTSQMRFINPNSLVLWYDAVTIEGTLRWQDKLSPLNKPFFDCCDGIFINYTWSLGNIDESIRMLTALNGKDIVKPNSSLFFGCDVFGRGSFGGGKYLTHTAIKALRCAGVSAAVFAPGWVLEDRVSERLRNYSLGEVVLDMNERKVDNSSLHTYGQQQALFLESFALWNPIVHAWTDCSDEIMYSTAETVTANYYSDYLFINFSQACGERIFWFGQAYQHWSLGCLTRRNESIAQFGKQSEWFYDLTLQRCNWKIDSILTSSTISKDGYVCAKCDLVSVAGQRRNQTKCSLSFEKAFIGTSSLALSMDNSSDCPPTANQIPETNSAAWVIMWKGKMLMRNLFQSDKNTWLFKIAISNDNIPIVDILFRLVFLWDTNILTSENKNELLLSASSCRRIEMSTDLSDQWKTYTFELEPRICTGREDLREFELAEIGVKLQYFNTVCRPVYIGVLSFARTDSCGDSDHSYCLSDADVTSCHVRRSTPEKYCDQMSVYESSCRIALDAEFWIDCPRSVPISQGIAFVCTNPSIIEYACSLILGDRKYNTAGNDMLARCFSLSQSQSRAVRQRIMSTLGNDPFAPAANVRIPHPNNLKGKKLGPLKFSLDLNLSEPLGVFIESTSMLGSQASMLLNVRLLFPTFWDCKDHQVEEGINRVNENFILVRIGP